MTQVTKEQEQREEKIKEMLRFKMADEWISSPPQIQRHIDRGNEAIVNGIRFFMAGVTEFELAAEGLRELPKKTPEYEIVSKGQKGKKA